jgi:tetratricopeptide (TPR) repeat protein
MHFSLGNALRDQGGSDQAIESYRSALSLNPAFAEVYCNLGLVFQGKDEKDAAVECYQRALSLKPDLVEAHSNLGAVLQAQGKLEAAIESCQKAVSLKPDYVAAHNNLGNSYLAQGALTQAVDAYQRAIFFRPDCAESYFNLGNAFKDQNKFVDAIPCYQKAVFLKPDYAVAYLNLGSVFQGANQVEAAIENYKKALLFKPEYADAYCNLGNAFKDLGRFDSAVDHYRHALEIAPGFFDAHNNLGLTFQSLEQYADAADSYKRALVINPDVADTLCNLGFVLGGLLRHQEALASYAAALRLQPDCLAAYFNEGLTRLLLGDFESGFKRYEWRWRLSGLKKHVRDFAQPLWLGEESLRDKTVLLHAEQGFGDTIQFCRYTKLVAAKGATVLLEVQPGLDSLLSGLEGVSQVLVKGEPLPAFDYHCPLMSLPLAFNTNLTSIPSASFYLASDPARVAAWREKLGEKTQLRVGLAWSGNRGHLNDHHRSIALARFVELLSDRVQNVCLQNEVSESDRQIMSCRKDIGYFGDDLLDFSETAALLSQMDLVISIDSVIAHLAGAMGKPVWLLLPFSPDWRWLMDRDNSPWYPSARLFRQPRYGDWDSVVSMLAKEVDVWSRNSAP